MNAIKTKPRKPAPKPPAVKMPITPPVIPSTNKDDLLDDLQRQLELLKNLVFEHNRQIVDLQEEVARKRKAVSNGKVRIRDKQTGKVYPSKNNAYQSLLKSGDLKELVEKGLFGDAPEKNTFGWYALKREWPDRFEEVKDVGDAEASGSEDK